MHRNFDDALAFVWRAGFDTPADGYHTTAGDAGGGTFGGVTEPTWRAAVAAKVVPPILLKTATIAHLGDVLRWNCWGTACDALADGLDLMVFNGRMMTGAYGRLLQQCLGLTGPEADNLVGSNTTTLAGLRDTATLIHALHGAHHAYLSQLSAWPLFGVGWHLRLMAARQEALRLHGAVPMV